MRLKLRTVLQQCGQPRSPCSSHRRYLYQRRSYSRSAESSSSPSPQARPPPSPPSAGKTPVPNRRLISLHGPDAPAFLHGLCTASVSHHDAFALGAFYNAFLNAQGRVLSEGFVWQVGQFPEFRKWISNDTADAGAQGKRRAEWQVGDPAFLLEVDSAIVEDIRAHLRRHKLRSKVGIRTVDDGAWDVWAAWTPADIPGEGPVEKGPADNNAPTKMQRQPAIPEEGSSKGSSPFIATQDARAPGLGHRILLPPSICAAGFGAIDPTYFRVSSSSAKSISLSTLTRAPASAYTIRRHLAGVPEGVTEIPPSSALPQESVMDMTGALDFRKGCYVGQELTIRTHHTGVVRKRILPCVLYEGDTPPTTRAYAPESLSAAGEMDVAGSVPSGTDIKKVSQGGARARALGKWLAGEGNIGLTLCRIENMTDVRITEEGGGFAQGDEFMVRWTKRNESEGDGSAGEQEQEMKVKAFVPPWQQGRYRTMKARVGL